MNEREAILMLIETIDRSMREARELIELHKLAGVKTPEAAKLMQSILVEGAKLMGHRAFLVKVANEKYGMNIE